MALAAQSTNERLLSRQAQFCAEGTGASGNAYCMPANDGVWLSNTGERAQINGGASAPGFETQQYQFMAGYDWGVGADTTLGAALGYGHSDLSEDQTGNTSRADTLSAALYGTRAIGALRLSGVLSYAYDDMYTRRPLGAAGIAYGNTGGNQLTAGMQAGVPVELGGMTFTPRVGMMYGYFHGNSFGESGIAGQDLNVGSQTIRTLQPDVDLSVAKTFGDSTRPISVLLDVGYARELLSDTRNMSVSTQDGTQFAASGAALPRSQVFAGLQVDTAISKNLHLSAGYTGAYNAGGGVQQTINVTMRYAF